ncbi:MAG: hypothetical protein ACYCXN_11890 [Acidimicrobiales bacterium]
MKALRIGVVATTAPWSAALRSYVRDHSRGATVEVVMDRPGLEAALPDLDVLVVDDIMRTFSVYDVSRAQSFGVHVIAVVDQANSASREHVNSLGVDQVLGSNLPPGELLAAVVESGSDGRDLSAPRRALSGFVRGPRVDGQNFRRKESGWVCAWTKASGGAGLTEAVIAAALTLSKRYRVLLVEAEEVAPVLLSRLSRSPEGGLPWALSRAGQGLAALPEGLSRLRPGAPAGRDCFDVVCAAPSAAHEVNAAQLDRFLAEASTIYEYVLVETSWLLGASSARERFSAARAVLRGAACIVVMATADPEGAGRLVQWKVAALGAGVGAPAFAAFGRSGASKYEREHLRSVVEANTGRHPYAGFAFLPLDPRVARARWNGEVVLKGPFVESVGALAARTAAVAASSGSTERRDFSRVRTA